MAKKAAAKPEKSARKAVSPIPKGYPVLIPYLSVKGAAEAIRFYTTILGGKERMRMPGPNGSVGHAEIELGGSVLMLADEMPGQPAPAPSAAAPSMCPGLCLYVKDVDETFRRAVEAGSKVIKPVQNQFYGDRSGAIIDPFGYAWNLATHVEDVSPEEMKKRMAELMKPKS